MKEVYSYVGPSVKLQDGTEGEARGAKSAGLVVSDAHGRHYEEAERASNVAKDAEIAQLRSLVAEHMEMTQDECVGSA